MLQHRQHADMGLTWASPSPTATVRSKFRASCRLLQAWMPRDCDCMTLHDPSQLLCWGPCFLGRCHGAPRHLGCGTFRRRLQRRSVLEDGVASIGNSNSSLGLGYVMFLFACVQLPAPCRLGKRIPRPGPWVKGVKQERRLRMWHESLCTEMVELSTPAGVDILLLRGELCNRSPDKPASERTAASGPKKNNLSAPTAPPPLPPPAPTTE